MEAELSKVSVCCDRCPALLQEAAVDVQERQSYSNADLQATKVEVWEPSSAVYGLQEKDVGTLPTLLLSPAPESEAYTEKTLDVTLEELHVDKVEDQNLNESSSPEPHVEARSPRVHRILGVLILLCALVFAVLGVVVLSGRMMWQEAASSTGFLLGAIPNLFAYLSRSKNPPGCCLRSLSVVLIFAAPGALLFWPFMDLDMSCQRFQLSSEGLSGVPENVDCTSYFMVLAVLAAALLASALLACATASRHHRPSLHARASVKTVVCGWLVCIAALKDVYVTFGYDDGVEEAISGLCHGFGQTAAFAQCLVACLLVRERVQIVQKVLNDAYPQPMARFWIAASVAACAACVLFAGELMNVTTIVIAASILIAVSLLAIWWICLCNFSTVHVFLEHELEKCHESDHLGNEMEAALSILCGDCFAATLCLLPACLLALAPGIAGILELEGLYSAEAWMVMTVFKSLGIVCTSAGVSLTSGVFSRQGPHDTFLVGNIETVDRLARRSVNRHMQDEFLSEQADGDAEESR